MSSSISQYSQMSLFDASSQESGHAVAEKKKKKKKRKRSSELPSSNGEFVASQSDHENLVSDKSNENFSSMSSTGGDEDGASAILDWSQDTPPPTATQYFDARSQLSLEGCLNACLTGDELDPSHDKSSADDGTRFSPGYVARIVSHDSFPLPSSDTVHARAGNEILSSETSGLSISYRLGEIVDDPSSPCTSPTQPAKNADTREVYRNLQNSLWNQELSKLVENDPLDTQERDDDDDFREKPRKKRKHGDSPMNKAHDEPSKPRKKKKHRRKEEESEMLVQQPASLHNGGVDEITQSYHGNTTDPLVTEVGKVKKKKKKKSRHDEKVHAVSSDLEPVEGAPLSTISEALLSAGDQPDPLSEEVTCKSPEQKERKKKKKHKKHKKTLDVLAADQATVAASEIGEFRDSATSSTTEVVEDVGETRNSPIAACSGVNGEASAEDEAVEQGGERMEQLAESNREFIRHFLLHSSDPVAVSSDQPELIDEQGVDSSSGSLSARNIGQVAEALDHRTSDSTGDHVSSESSLTPTRRKKKRSKIRRKSSLSPAYEQEIFPLRVTGRDGNSKKHTAHIGAADDSPKSAADWTSESGEYGRQRGNHSPSQEVPSVDTCDDESSQEHENVTGGGDDGEIGGGSKGAGTKSPAKLKKKKKHRSVLPPRHVTFADDAESAGSPAWDHDSVENGEHAAVMDVASSSEFRIPSDTSTDHANQSVDESTPPQSADDEPYEHLSDQASTSDSVSDGQHSTKKQKQSRKRKVVHENSGQVEDETPSKKKKKKKKKAEQNEEQVPAQAAQAVDEIHDEFPGTLDHIPEEVAKQVEILHSTNSTRMSDFDQDIRDCLIEQGVTIREGRWSKEEKKRLQHNWETFFERHAFAYERYVILNYKDEEMDRIEKREIQQFVANTQFYIWLGQGILRPLHCVYYAARALFHPHYRGDCRGSNKYTASENAIIKKYFAEGGVKIKHLAEKLKRSTQSVKAHLQRRKDLVCSGEDTRPSGARPWCLDRDRMLLTAILELTNRRWEDVNGLTEEQLPYTQIAQVMPFTFSQCRNRWLSNLVPFLLWHQPGLSWGAEHQLQVFRSVAEQTQSNEKTIDWKAVQAKMEKPYPVNFYMSFWSKLVNRIPNSTHMSLDGGLRKRVVTNTGSTVQSKQCLRPPVLRDRLPGKTAPGRTDLVEAVDCRYCARWQKNVDEGKGFSQPGQSYTLRELLEPYEFTKDEVRLLRTKVRRRSAARSRRAARNFNHDLNDAQASTMSPGQSDEAGGSSPNQVRRRSPRTGRRKSDSPLADTAKSPKRTTPRKVTQRPSSQKRRSPAVSKKKASSETDETSSPARRELFKSAEFVDSNDSSSDDENGT